MLNKYYFLVRKEEEPAKQTEIIAGEEERILKGLVDYIQCQEEARKDHRFTPIMCQVLDDTLSVNLSNNCRDLYFHFLFYWR